MNNFNLALSIHSLSLPGMLCHASPSLSVSHTHAHRHTVQRAECTQWTHALSECIYFGNTLFQISFTQYWQPKNALRIAVFICVYTNLLFQLNVLLCRIATSLFTLSTHTQHYVETVFYNSIFIVCVRKQTDRFKPERQPLHTDPQTQSYLESWSLTVNRRNT